MRTWKRIIVYIVVVALSVGCMVFPAEAASSKSAITNLMAPDAIYTVGTASYADGGYFNVVDNTIKAKNAYSGSMRWVLFNPEICSSVYFTLRCDMDPGNVYWIFYDTNVKAQRISVDGDLYTFKLTNDTQMGSVGLFFDFTGFYNGVIELVSAFGVEEYAHELTNVTLENQRLTYFAGTDQLKRTTFENLKNVSLPCWSVTKSEYLGEVIDPLLGGYFYLINEYSDIGYSFCDSITYVIQTCGTADYTSDNPNFSATLIDSAGYYTTNLPVEIIGPSTYMGTGVYFGSSDLQWPYYHYTVVVDTSGYDLTGCSIMIDYQVDPVYVEEYDGYTGYMTKVHSIVAMPTLEESPWYAEIGYWMKSGFNKVVKAIEDAFSSGNNGELSQAGDDLKQSAGEINSAGEALGAVSQPDVDAGELITDLTNFDTGGLRVLSCITSNGQVTAMMVIVFTFCLAGYIFFGKKG